MIGRSLPAGAAERFRADLESLVGGIPGSVGLAVSGGQDSLALLLLGQAVLPGRIRVATIDHGLRPEAAEEALFVQSVCARLGVEHEILRPDLPITGNLQSGARRARYDLLEAWRGAQALDWLATAHHLDDQAETVVMRLNRGSGVAGLAGVRAINGRVVRPLLRWRRAELDSIVSAAGIAPVEDPSNSDHRFDRVRVRQRLGQADWLDPVALAKSAAALAAAEEALEWATDRLWAERVVQSGGSVRISAGGLPDEYCRRLVRRALLELMPLAEIRGEELGRLIAALKGGRAATLAGVKATATDSWEFTIAPPRRGGLGPFKA